MYPWESSLCFRVLCFILIHSGSCLGLLLCSGCFCNSQEDSIHTRWETTKDFKTFYLLLPAVVVFLPEEQRIHSHQVFQDHQEPKGSTLGTHSTNGLQEDNVFSSLPLFHPFIGNGILFKEAKQNTDSILPNLLCLCLLAGASPSPAYHKPSNKYFSHLPTLPHRFWGSYPLAFSRQSIFKLPLYSRCVLVNLDRLPLGLPLKTCGSW